MNIVQTIFFWISNGIIASITLAILMSWIITIIAKTPVDGIGKTIFASLLWYPTIYIRLWLVLIGIFVAVPLSLLGDGQYRTPKMWWIWADAEKFPMWSRWEKWWEMAIRNPTMGLRKNIKQPILEPRPNPDDVVYGGKQKSATRWLRHENYAEFWYLRAIGKKKLELRFGWKFADGTPGFVPTLSARFGA